MSFQMSLQNHVARAPTPHMQTSAPPPPQPPQPFYFASDRGVARYPVQEPAWRHRHSVPVPDFR